MQSALSSSARRRLNIIRCTRFLLKHWLAIFVVLFGLVNVLPFLAPVVMRWGWAGVGNAIYRLYAPLCHQMAQRSFFLFGPRLMYNADQLPVELVGSVARDTMSLRLFTGNSALGWKVAWSDRMVYMYGGLWIAGITFWILSRRRTVKPLSLWLFGLLILPMIVDGFTHVISDLDGITQGFRYDNIWLANLTRHVLPDSFYRGDALGSFNSWMRLLSGLSFGIACGALGLPIIDRSMRANARILTFKLNRVEESVLSDLRRQEIRPLPK